jgi:hypothetical protein
MVDVSRVQKELTECNRDREVSGVSIALHDGASISHLTGTIAGPKESPYEGGTFVIDIRLPSNPPPPPSSDPFPVTRARMGSALPLRSVTFAGGLMRCVADDFSGYRVLGGGLGFGANCAPLRLFTVRSRFGRGVS